MWGAFLSEPLRIVGTVGRYPAVYLMRRMSILCRISPLTSRECSPKVLRGIRPDFSGLSPCIGQVTYVLLTRAPVAGRHIATPPLPLDLHVLSLSLAFILSQDQTLRCCLSYVFLFQVLFARQTFQISPSLYLQSETTVNANNLTIVILLPSRDLYFAVDCPLTLLKVDGSACLDLLR